MSRPHPPPLGPTADQSARLRGIGDRVEQTYATEKHLIKCGAWGWPTCRAGAPQRAHDPNQFAHHGRSARRKAFATAATLDTHNRSKKHKEIVFEAAFALKASDLVAPVPAPAAVSEPEVEVEQDEDAAMAEAVALSVADPDRKSVV